MESVQFNFIAYWVVRNYKSINEQYYQYEKSQGQDNLEQKRAGKGHNHQYRQQENTDHLIYQEHDEYIHVGGIAYIEYPAHQFQHNEFA